jgi:hypothetical protein
MEKIKHILLIAFVSLFTFSAFSQGYKPGYTQSFTDDFEYKAWFEKNNIKKCVITSDIEVDKTEKGYKKDRYGGDPTIEIIQLKKTNSGKIYSYRSGKDLETYTYNSSDQLISYVRKDEDGYTEKTILTYSLNGRLAVLEKYSKRVLRARYSLIYDEKGRLVEEKSHSKIVNFSGDAGYTDQTLRLTYDDQNRCIEAIRYDVDKKEIDHIKIAYKNGGNRFEITQKSGYLTNFVPEMTYVYDEKGNEIERLSYSHGGSLDFRLVFSYYNDDQLEKFQRFNENNKVITDEEFSYNEHNDVLKIINKAFNANETTFEYTYDKNGQWTEQVGTEKGRYSTKYSMTKRKISYN